ncbi:MAG: hypothetical protein L0322_07050 [Chloroflexi bacterium]|nr:hypothetical protein [Chloroflexota bacterium]
MAWFSVRSLPGPATEAGSDNTSPLYLFLCIYLTVAFHEAGHLLAGALNGFHFISTSIGPFRLTREFQGLKLRYDGFELFDFSGDASSVPTRPDHIHRREILMTAGGPLATLLQIAVVVVLRLTFHQQIIVFWQAELLFWLAFCAIVVLLLTLLPLPGLQNDVSHMLSTLKSPPLPKRRALLTMYYGASAQGQQSGALDAARLAELLIPEDGSIEELEANVVAYVNAVSQGEIRRAGAFLDRCLAILQILPTEQRWVGVLIEAAYFEARFEQNLAAARDWLTLAHQYKEEEYNLLTEQALLRAEAAVLLAEAKPAEAARKASASLVLLDRFTDIGNAKTEKEWLESMLSQISKLA